MSIKFIHTKFFIFTLRLCMGVCLISYLPSHSQNLVPNPSFEDTVTCPLFATQIENAIGWSSYRNSPDLYHSCSSTGTNVPNAVFGYQPAHSGNAMAGLIAYRRPNSPNGPNAREYMGCTLNAPLIPGIKYFISFYANFSFQPSIAIASNNIGIKLSTVTYDSSNPAPVNNQSHINYPTILSDSLNWTKISGSFIADSAYTYLIVGNFYMDQNTDTLILSPNPDNAYYYFDDICLSSDSNFCETWTTLIEFESFNEKVVIYPNPCHDSFTIRSDIDIEYYTLYNIFGVLISENPRFSNPLTVNFHDQPQGNYILKLVSKNHIIFRKIIKN